VVASLIFAVSVLAAPEIPLDAGTPITLDGKLQQGEWADAYHYSPGAAIHFYMKRNGPWLALGLKVEGPYQGEVLRVKVAGGAGAWLNDLLFPVGQPGMAPLLWRRGAPGMLARARPGAGVECARACRARVLVNDEQGWSAEYHVRMSALGIGRADMREFRVMIALHRPGPTPRDLFVLPAGLKKPYEPAQFARLTSSDGWGAKERWAPVPAAVSQEFDDNALLFRLYREQEGFARRSFAESLVISNAVRPRSDARIRLLRDAILAGRKRNPTLPAWTYFLGRLLHEANLYADARKIVEAIPAPLRGLDPYVNLAAEHYLDTGDWEKALEICQKHPQAAGMGETLRLVLAERRGAIAEKKALEKDARKREKNPRVKLVTEKGDIVVELFEDDAPNAVRNFMDLVLHRHYYDKMRFHDVMGGSFVRVGDPRTRPGATTKMDGPPWRLRMDKSPRVPLRGYLATVPAQGNAYHGSQFLITVAPMMREQSKLTVFGRVIQGQEVVESLEQNDRLERIEVLFRRNHTYDALGARFHQ